MFHMAPGIDSQEYDRQWQGLDDFIKFNPGARHRRRIVLDIVKGLVFRSMLDVGCGTGAMLTYLQKHLAGNIACWGVDFAPEAIQRNAARMPEINFACLNIEQGALDRTFDLVICSEVLEHLHDRVPAFNHLARMVHPGGYLLVTCPTGRLYATERYFGHVSHPTLDELTVHAHHNQLTVVRSLTWGWPVYRMVKMINNLNPEWTIKTFGQSQYSWGKKFLNHVIFAANFMNLASSPYGCQLFVLCRKPPAV